MPWPEEVNGDDMVAAMDAVGVDGALFVSPFAMYRYDASYALEVQNAHPDRFALVKPVYAAEQKTSPTVNSSNDRALYVSDLDGELELVARKGDLLEVLPG